MDHCPGPISSKFFFENLQNWIFFENPFIKDKSEGLLIRSTMHKKVLKLALNVELAQLKFTYITVVKYPKLGHIVQSGQVHFSPEQWSMYKPTVYKTGNRTGHNFDLALAIQTQKFHLKLATDHLLPQHLMWKKLERIFFLFFTLVGHRLCVFFFWDILLVVIYL